MKTSKSQILSKVQGDLKGHGAFNLHHLLHNHFTADDFSNFTISYKASNEVVINIGDKNEAKSVEHTSIQSKPVEKVNEVIEVDPPSDPDILVHSSASEGLNHQDGSSREQIVKDLLNACFGSDKNTRLKIESQIHAMFSDNSGMFQFVLSDPS